MKFLKHILLITFICPLYSFSQIPGDIETNLCNLFSRIDYWQQKENEAAFAVSASDSLGAANDAFARKLLFYTEKYPATITHDFKQLKKARLDISSSADGLFRIYSWDTETGGTMHFFESVFQYKSGLKTMAILDTPREEGDVRPDYDKIFTFKNAGKTYYMCNYFNIGSTKDMSQGIQIFAIENGKLEDNVKLIKTKHTFRSRLGFDFNFLSKVYWKVSPKIYFNPVLKTINVPLVDANYNMTNRFIVYKFNGKYFERVKN